MSEYFLLVYTLMHSIIGHVLINNTSGLLTLPDDQEDNSSWDTWYLHQDITYEYIRAFYATAHADEEDIILHEKGTVESEYDTELDDGED
jgi:hypothetical protein